MKHVYLVVTLLLTLLTSGFGQTLSVTKTLLTSNKVVPGDKIEYEISVSNPGPGKVDILSVTDNLPPLSYYYSDVYAYYYDANGNLVEGDNSENTIVWTNLSVDAGTTTFYVTLTAGDIHNNGIFLNSEAYYIAASSSAKLTSETITLENTVVVTTNSQTYESNDGNPVSVDVDQRFGLYFILPGEGQVKASTGATVKYLFAVQNTGTVVDNFSFELNQHDDCNSNQHQVSISYLDKDGIEVPSNSTGWMQPGDIYYYYLYVYVDQSSSNCYEYVTVTAASTVFDNASVDSQIEIEIKNTNGPLVGSFVTDLPDPVDAGGELTYIISVTNSGYGSNSTAEGVYVTEHYPIGLDPAYVTAVYLNDPAYPLTPTEPNKWPIGDIGAGATENIYIKVDVPTDLPNGTKWSNWVSIEGLNFLLVNSLPQETTILSAPDLVVTNIGNPTNIKPGQTVDYTLTYKNVGNRAALATHLVVTYDNSQISNVSASGGGTVDQTAGTITWDLGDVAPNSGETELTYSGTLMAGYSTPGVTAVQTEAEISFTGTYTDPITPTEKTPYNNTAYATVYVEVLPDLVVSKEVDSTPLVPGEQSIYTLTITNIGLVDAVGVELKDLLPDGLVIFDAGGGTPSLSYNPGDLTDGQSIIWSGLNVPVTVFIDDVATNPVTKQIIVIPDCSLKSTPVTNVAEVKLENPDESEGVGNYGNNTSSLGTGVVDNTAPALNPGEQWPSDQTNIVDCMTNALAGPSDAEIADLYSDACGGTITVTHTVTSSGNNCSWEYIYVYSIKDASGNEVTPKPELIISGGDTESPALSGTLPGGDLGNVCVSDVPSAPAAAAIAALYTDNCSAVTATLSNTNITDENSSWTATYIYTISDGCNSFDVDVIYTGRDSEDPKISCPGNITRTSNPGVCEINISISTPAVTDNCSATVSGVRDDNLALTAPYPAGITRITWTAIDAGGNTDECIQRITVKSPPVAVDDGVDSFEDIPAIFNVLANDTDCDDNLLANTVQILVPPLHGTAIANVDGTISFTAELNYYGYDELIYRVCDADGQCDDAVVTIRVGPVNDAPDAVDDYFIRTDATANILDNDSDLDGDAIILNTSPVSGPLHGDLIINSDGTFTYTPDDFYFGKDSFIYEICDDYLEPLCDQATVVLVNDMDNDGVDDTADLDDDNDGIPDVDEGDQVVDTDGDKLPDSLDIDSDNDGIPDNFEGQSLLTYHFPIGIDANNNGWDDAYDPGGQGEKMDLVDTDMDGSPDFMDTDSDDDYITDDIEAFDTDKDGVAETLPSGNDADMNGMDDAYVIHQANTDYTTVVVMSDSDQDGHADWRDKDDDNDGILTSEEAANSIDFDQDGIVDYLDIDSDDDGILDNIESQSSSGYTSPKGVDTDGDGYDDAYDSDNSGFPIMMTDTDGDGDPDYLDEDTDNDLVPDYIEGQDLDQNGQPDQTYAGTDANDNGLDDVFENYTVPLQDTNGDGVPDWRDADDDGDNILTMDEDENNDGDPTNDDCNWNDIPNYLDLESCEFLLPNAFSPNGDGINDYFRVRGIFKYSDAHLEVYNRWGAKVFDMDKFGNVPLLGDPGAWWDGKSNVNGNQKDEILPAGTYFIILVLDNSSVHKGFVYINR